MNERQLHIETLLKTLRFAPVDFDALFAENTSSTPLECVESFLQVSAESTNRKADSNATQTSQSPICQNHRAV